MSNTRYSESFSIGEGYSTVTYTVELKKDGELSFFAKSRDPVALGFSDDSWNMPEFYVTYSTTGAGRAPVSVMRRIGSIVENWIRFRDVDYMWFSSHDAKKLEMYMRMSRRVSGIEEFDIGMSRVGIDYVVNIVRV
jgi:hypothetical protein